VFSRGVVPDRVPDKGVSFLSRDVTLHVMRTTLQRSVSGEGHLNGKFPPPKEASKRNRLLIYTDTPTQINSETLVTPRITEDILSYIIYNYYVIS
jgi:hypothetical protein